MKSKKIIFLILFIALLMIGSVNASIQTNDDASPEQNGLQAYDNANQIDMNTTDANKIIKTESPNQNTIVIADDSEFNQEDIENANVKLATKENDKANLGANEQINVENYNQLYTQIENLKKQGTSESYIINLNAKGSYIITDTLVWGGEKSAARNLTINGNGATIDGKGSKSFLTIFPYYSVTLNNLNFVNNFRNIGGGGAIFTQTNGTLIVNNCNFTNCIARNNPVEEDIHGGAIRGGYNATIHINNSIFKNNFATFGGGAIVIGATITNITASSGMDVTAIDPKLIISNSQFINNSAGHAGAINIEEFCASIISNCTFKDNSAIDSADGIGGGICTDERSYLVSINNTFQNNTGKKSAGAIYNGPNSTVQISKNTFTGNQAPYGASVCNQKDSTLTVADSIFQENKATDSGGSIHNTENNIVTVNNCKFNQNKATANGGAISNVNNNKITITDCTFNNNMANYGGAIYSAKNNDISIKNTGLSSNQATTNGGGIYTGTNTNLSAINTTLNSNKASIGGAICSDANSIITLDNSSLAQNNATNGGAIFNSDGIELTISQSILKNNIANSNGGAIYSIKNNKILIRNTELANNQATTNGGGIYTGTNTNLTTSSTTFDKNIAKNLGGAICSGSDSIVTLANSKFNDNDANIGYAIFNPNQGTLIFKGNTSLKSEDYKNNGELKIEDTINTQISIDSIEYSSELIVKGRLVDEYGSPISNENIVINMETQNDLTAKTDNNGNFIAKYANIVPGTYKFTASFNNRNSVYNPSTTNITKKLVEKQNSKLTVANVTTIYDVEKNLVINLTDSQDKAIAKATVSVDLGTGATNYTTDNNGQIKVSTKGLIPKIYTAVIRFEGNEYYKETSSNATIIVNKADSKISLSSSQNDNGITLTATLSPSTATGNVIFEVNKKNYTAKISLGKATQTISDLNNGNYTIKASYEGDTYLNSSSANTIIIVQKSISTKIVYNNMTTGPVTKAMGRIGNYFCVKLTDDKNNALAGLPIAIGFNGKIYNKTTDSKGGAKLQINLPREGKYTFAIGFLGDDNREASFEVAKIEVSEKYPKPNKANETSGGEKANTSQSKTKLKTYIDYKDMNTKSVISAEGRAGDYFIVTLLDNNKKAFANMPIKIGFNGKIYNKTTDSNGKAKLQINLLKPTLYTFAICYLGDSKYQASLEVAKITVNAQTPKLTSSSKTFKASAKTKSLTANLVSFRGKAISGQKITFTVNCKTYTGKTNAKGVATVKISLNKKGTYSCAVKFAGMNGVSAKSTRITVKIA